MSSSKCRHRFEPRYTSGLSDSEVLARMAATLLSSDCSEVVWRQFNKTVAEYRKAKVYVGDICRKCGLRIEPKSSRLPYAADVEHDSK